MHPTNEQDLFPVEQAELAVELFRMYETDGQELDAESCRDSEAAVAVARRWALRLATQSGPLSPTSPRREPCDSEPAHRTMPERPLAETWRRRQRMFEVAESVTIQRPVELFDLAAVPETQLKWDAAALQRVEKLTQEPLGVGCPLSRRMSAVVWHERSVL